MFRSPTSEVLSRELQNKKIKENSSLSYFNLFFQVPFKYFLATVIFIAVVCLFNVFHG